MPKKDSEEKQVVGDGTEEAAADFDKHTGDVEEPEVEENDGPHGHPFQPTSAEPVLVTHGGSDDEARGQTTVEQRREGHLKKISVAEAYDDPEFNPVAAADVPGHKGGPQAEGGTERPVGVTDDGSGDKENSEKLNFNWKNEDSQPK